MVYMGSKSRYAKELLPIILQNRRPGQYYVEPFCGGCNTIDKVDGPRIANDSNHYLISLFQYLQNGGVLPEHVTEQEYRSIKSDPYLFDDWLVAYAATCFTFSSKWFGSYIRGNGCPSNLSRDMKKEKINNLLSQVPKLTGIEFHAGSYLSLSIPDKSIIYCDPPYAGTTGYKDPFDHVIFWEWVREKQAQGHWVYVSEYTAPDDFLCVWSKELKQTFSNNSPGAVKPVERLFM